MYDRTWFTTSRLGSKFSLLLFINLLFIAHTYTDSTAVRVCSRPNQKVKLTMSLSHINRFRKTMTKRIVKPQQRNKASQPPLNIPTPPPQQQPLLDSGIGPTHHSLRTDHQTTRPRPNPATRSLRHLFRGIAGSVRGSNRLGRTTAGSARSVCSRWTTTAPGSTTVWATTTMGTLCGL